MAIIKRPRLKGAVYQVRLRGTDGGWITESFQTRRDAEIQEMELKRQMFAGTQVCAATRQMTVSEYFARWIAGPQELRASLGWRKTQVQVFGTYIAPVMGNVKLPSVTPAHVARVLQEMVRMGRAPQTCQHAYAVLHAMFQHAVEDDQVLSMNPVRRKLKPRIPQKEALFLEVEEARRLLAHARGKPFDVPIWLGVYVGLRIGEIQALTWDNIDLDHGVLHVRKTFVRKENRIKEFPKGRRWHDVALPPELWEMLRSAKVGATCELVCHTSMGGRMSYWRYLDALKQYARDVGITKDIASHALRHSTSRLWMNHGAGREDVQAMFAHSSSAVTDRYIHGSEAKRLRKFANVIQLFPDGCSPNVPQTPFREVDAG